MGKGSIGPLAQLGILREYGLAVQPKSLLWFIFTGNDLKNLREEKTSRLINYLDRSYSQNLLMDEVTDTQLKDFLEDRIQMQVRRNSIGLPFKDNIGTYGESLDSLEIKEEWNIFEKICDEVLYESQKQNLNLTVIELNHAQHYPSWIMQETSQFLKEYTQKNDIKHVIFTTEYLKERQDEIYPCCGVHLMLMEIDW